MTARFKLPVRPDRCRNSLNSTQDKFYRVSELLKASRVSPATKKLHSGWRRLVFYAAPSRPGPGKLTRLAAQLPGPTGPSTNSVFLYIFFKQLHNNCSFFS